MCSVGIPVSLPTGRLWESFKMKSEIARVRGGTSNGKAQAQSDGAERRRARLSVGTVECPVCSFSESRPAAGPRFYYKLKAQINLFRSFRGQSSTKTEGTE